MKKNRAASLSACFLFAVVLFFFSSPSSADPLKEPLSEVVQKTQEAYEKVRDIEADFTQRVVFKDFDTPFTSEGQVYLKRGKMRWDYREPSKQQIFVEDEKVLYYVPEHRQVIKSNLASEADSQVPIGLLAGTARLSQDFDISFEESDGSAYHLKLIPKDRNMRTVKIQIEVSPASHLIQKITLHEVNGNRSVFNFSGLKVNQGLKDDVFSFIVPKGVEVVEAPPVH
jgi:outer membrane lipoprotein carrier protein